MIRESEQPSYTKREVRGCIDLGSSNFRLLVVEGAFPPPGRGSGSFELGSSAEEKRYVGWGDDLARAGCISPERQTRAAAALGELLGSARALACARPILVATNTLRESSNAGAVRAALERGLDVSIRVLTQREEAALTYAGASFFRGSDEAICLVDIGGTSTEIAWGRGTAMHGCAGLPLGTHRAHRLLRGAFAERRESLLLAAELEEAGVYRLPAFSGDPTILLTGGTAVSLAVFHRHMLGYPPSFEELHRLSSEDVALVRRRIGGLIRADRERFIPLDPHRRRLFPAGLVLIDALLRSSRVDVFRVTARDLRWGAVLTGGALT
jgi:exopolyphosphatase/guanosine-5'-triphosphate,3'-diphosphate pyrophosphatase